ncbi:MAG: hypothetical protein PVF74_01260 [Anaerolineales bacterium]|jgi:hypothetical protein
MNTKFLALVESISLALLSLALYMTAVGVTPAIAGSVNPEIESDADKLVGADNRKTSPGRSDSSKDEYGLPLEQYSIHLPVLIYKPPHERAALMAIYNSTEGEGWYKTTLDGVQAHRIAPGMALRVMAQDM